MRHVLCMAKPSKHLPSEQRLVLTQFFTLITDVLVVRFVLRHMGVLRQAFHVVAGTVWTFGEVAIACLIWRGELRRLKINIRGVGAVIRKLGRGEISNWRYINYWLGLNDNVNFQLSAAVSAWHYIIAVTVFDVREWKLKLNHIPDIIFHTDKCLVVWYYEIPFDWGKEV